MVILKQRKIDKSNKVGRLSGISKFNKLHRSRKVAGANTLAALSAVAVALFCGSVVSSLTSSPSSSMAHAADSPAKVTVSVDEACSLSGETGDTPHTLTNPTIGAWNAGIGATNVTAICNDNGGYDIYAVGYSGDEWKNTNLINTSDSSVTIGTRDYDSSYTSSSYWSMQLSSDTSTTESATIIGPYNSYSAVPSDYTKVATYPSNTTGASGSSFKTTYGVYLTATQAIGTYQGQVKYTLVHPNGAEAPEAKDPSYCDTHSCPNIQDLTLAQCQVNVGTNDNPTNVGDEITVVDSRDDKEYTVRYINGACWMTQNLRYLGDTGSTSGSMTMKSATSNISADKTVTYYELKGTQGSSSSGKCYGNGTSGNGYSNACTHTADSTDVSEAGSSACGGKTCTTDQLGVWYNYMAATAGTISGTSNSTADTYNICPKNWTLPANGTSTGQIGSVTSYASSFNPLYGGYYSNGSHGGATTLGYWWSATARNAYNRYYLYYNSGSLNTLNNYRYLGFYVRCVRTS